MAYTYHPPTRTFCPVCEELEKNRQKPIIDSVNGKASFANNFPIHNWYHFVLGYTPEFPDFMIVREHISPTHFVVDPFMGAGTTLVCCKFKGIPSAGVDANDYFVDVARSKLNWSLSVDLLKEKRDRLLPLVSKKFETLDFDEHKGRQLPLFVGKRQMPVEQFASQHRPEMLPSRYISDRPFAKAYIIKALIDEKICDEQVKQLFNVAISAILLPISNVKYGPGFGITKPKSDVDVLKTFKEKIDRMITDLQNIPKSSKTTPAQITLGDARRLSEYFSPNSVDFMITSPPYPGDHEYTKHTRLEFLFMGYANTHPEFRTIKRRMIRGSTTNIYKDDNNGQYVQGFKSIQNITELIAKRLQKDGATSGFEKLYTKLVWEYFGGMHLALSEACKVMKKGGKFSLLVSDSHAFKMVHIPTASILAEIGMMIGYKHYSVDLWQDKISTSHKYQMRENILTLIK